MILSDREIRAAVARGVIGVSELPPTESKRWASHALDLTLDTEISVWGPVEELKGVEPQIFSPGDEEFKADPIVSKYTSHDTCEGDGYVLLPSRFVLGWTAQKIKLPYESRIGARVEGKSSLARLGLGIHVTAPTIHPGFGTKEGDKGYAGSPLRLEIWNVGVYKIRLTKGMAICQILFEEVHGVPDAAYAGQFAVQGPGDTAPAEEPRPALLPQSREKPGAKKPGTKR
jgi:dCTP deaminase